MATRNHSRRVHAPYAGEQYGMGSGERFSGEGEYAMRRRERPSVEEETRDEQEEMGMVGDIARRHPYTTVLTGFGIGFGFGLFVTLLLTRREETWFERYAPESIQHWPDRLKQAREAAASYLPGSLKEAQESLASCAPRSWKWW
jgi:hypothetical protein